MNSQQKGSSLWDQFYGANAGYVMELYEQYCLNPSALDREVREFFDERGTGWETARGIEPQHFDQAIDADTIAQVARCVLLIEDIRREGHRTVHFDPFHSPEGPELFDPAQRGINLSTLASLPSQTLGNRYGSLGATVKDVLVSIRNTYLGQMGIEFEHLSDGNAREWLRQAVETPGDLGVAPAEQKQALLRELVEVEEFEKYLHQTFPGQKRFSIEGLDVIVPALNRLVELSASAEISNVVIGMAHRGRLNVLAHVLDKPLETIIAEFLHHRPGPILDDPRWTGDVKYHLGFTTLKMLADRTVEVILANNPSHLELVNPVVEGHTRALQDSRDQSGSPAQQVDQALAVVVHGDAAFDGEGVVAETLNLSRLSAYGSGGTIHIISNNDIGFTTETRDERSTRYASDLAKGYDIPILHVNADCPDTVLSAIYLAFAYRQRFHRDFLIDVVGYRRWGHNEGDEPAFTQPDLYQAIASHPTVAEIYANELFEAEILSDEDMKSLRQSARATLMAAHERASSQTIEESFGRPVPGPMPKSLPPLDEPQLVSWNRELLSVPDGFHLHPKLARVVDRHLHGLTEENAIDWAWAESLSFASILAGGIPIRMTGQDTERGTFSQRHLVWHDAEGGPFMVPLASFNGSRASFEVHNSPLSEVAVLGFEYGYSVRAPETLVIWEAQFGDFANVAQPVIDQFLAAGRAKWRQSSSLVLLLPHGYEGQGPEHSSARLERYLQLAAEDNFYVTNCTTAAQYFHLLRLQAERLGSDPRPLIIMTPKSLLRHPLAASSLSDLATGRFQPILELPLPPSANDSVRRVVFTSGKVAIDLKSKAESQPESDLEFLRVLRIEQLYPFPEEAIRAYLSQFPNLAEAFWLQEEPQNMGAYHFVADRLAAMLPNRIALTYVGRPPRASVATGAADVHAEEQQSLLEQSLQYSPAHRTKVRL